MPPFRRVRLASCLQRLVMRSRFGADDFHMFLPTSRPSRDGENGCPRKFFPMFLRSVSNSTIEYSRPQVLQFVQGQTFGRASQGARLLASSLVIASSKLENFPHHSAWISSSMTNIAMPQNLLRITVSATGAAKRSVRAHVRGVSPSR